MLDIIKLMADSEQKIRDDIADHIKLNPGELDGLVATMMDRMISENPNVVESSDLFSACKHLSDALRALSAELNDESLDKRADLLDSGLHGIALGVLEDVGSQLKNLASKCGGKTDDDDPHVNLN